MTPAAEPVPAVVFGEAATGTIGRAGGVDRFGFTVTEPTPVVFDALTNNAQLRWQIVGPTQTGAARAFTASDSSSFTGNPVMWLQPGTYQLSISANGAATGRYAFRLLSLAERTPIALGEAQSIPPNPRTAPPAFQTGNAAGRESMW